MSDIHATQMRPTLLLFPLLLTACSVHRLLPGTTYTPHAGKQRVENATAGVSVVYYGDYAFHQPRKRHYDVADRSWLRSRLKPKEAQAFLAAHTTIEPFGATLGLVHAQATVEALAAERLADEELTLRADSLHHEGGNTWRVLAYDRGKLTYLEYLTGKEDSTVCLLFWTRSGQAAWLGRESVPIVESYMGR